MATSNSGKLLSDVTERIALTSGWSGLVRWSLALGRISNESTCAAERAIVAAQMSVDCESKREWLVRKLEWFRDDFQSQLGSDEERSILGAISFEWNWEEVSTLELLHLWPLVTLCDGGSQLPPEHARQALTIGRDAAEACALLCHKLNDDVLLSTCFNQVGASYAYLGDHDRARTYYQRALHLRVRLAERLPTIYRKFVAGTMNNLGNALWNSGDLDAAATTLTDALNIRSELAESGVPDMTADIAITENDLANVLLELGRQTDAGKYYLSALKRFQILAQSFPDTYLEECARTSFNIAMNTLLSGDSTLALKQVQGSLEFWRRAQPYPAQKQLPLVEALIGESKIQLSLGNVQESVDSVSESINILDLLAGMCPDRFGEHYASALNQFGACAGLRKDHPLARRAHEKALEIYEWVRKRVPTTKRNIKVGSTLCLLADVLIDAGDHDAARKKVEEALLIYSSLPDEAKNEVFFGALPSRDRLVLTDTIGGGDRAFTFPRFDGKITLNMGPAAFADPRNYPGQARGQTFIHELVHACQIQHTNMDLALLADAFASKVCEATSGNPYAYGPAGPDYSSFNLEQQAQIVSDWFAGAVPPGSNQTGIPKDINSPYFRYLSGNLRVGRF
jgi:tetratricopeptide (TPR) repeat protein